MDNEVQTSQNTRANFIVGLILFAAVAASGQILVADVLVASVDDSNASSLILTRHDSTHSVSALSDGSLIAVGMFGRIFRSLGEHTAWQEISSPTIEDLYSIAFRDDLNGIAVGANGTYLETTDGGLSWNSRDMTTVSDSANDNNLMMVVLDPNGNGLIIGTFGLLWHTDSGGNTWESVTILWEEVLDDVWKNYGPAEAHLYGATITGSDVWVVGEYGLVLRSSNGGRSFEQRRGGQFTDSHLFSVTADPVDPSHVISVGQAGLIVSSSDDGMTWEESNRWETDLYDVLLYEGGAVISGDLGTVLHLPVSNIPDEYNVVAAAGWKDVVPLGDGWIIDVQHLGQGHFLALGKQSFSDFSLPTQRTNNAEE